MGSIAKDLVDYLDPLIAEAAGTNLFEGPETESPDDQIAVTHYGGEQALDRIMGDSLTVPGVEVATVQVLSRSTSMTTAQSRAAAVHAYLDNYNGTINSRVYFQVESINGMPFSMGQDANARWRFVCNYRCQHKRS